MATGATVIPPRPKPPIGRLCATLPDGTISAVSSEAYTQYELALRSYYAAIIRRAEEQVCDKS